MSRTLHKRTGRTPAHASFFLIEHTEIHRSWLHIARRNKRTFHPSLLSVRGKCIHTRLHLSRSGTRVTVTVRYRWLYGAGSKIYTNGVIILTSPKYFSSHHPFDLLECTVSFSPTEIHLSFPLSISPRSLSSVRRPTRLNTSSR